MAPTLREFLGTVEGGFAIEYVFSHAASLRSVVGIFVFGRIVERLGATLESQGITSVEAFREVDPDKDLTWPRGTQAGDKALARAGVAKCKADKKALRAAAAAEGELSRHLSGGSLAWPCVHFVAQVVVMLPMGRPKGGHPAWRKSAFASC